MNPTPHHLRKGASAAGGFSLLELLVVMGIIAILATLSITTFRSVNTALSLSTATQAVVSELSTARQTALTLNQTVEIRFYQFPDMTSATATKQFQALQSFRSRDNVTFIPLDKVLYLPPNIMISTNTTYSAPLGSATTTTAAANDPPILVNGVNRNYAYVSVRFKSNGTIDPQLASWFITLLEKRYATGTPVNYTTISVDPQNGRLRLFQP